MYVLTKTQEKFLKEAIDSAEGWRGTLIGNPDPEPLEAFDKEILAMRVALAKLIEQQRELRTLRTAARKLNASRIYCYIGPEDGGCIDIGTFTLL